MPTVTFVAHFQPLPRPRFSPAAEEMDLKSFMINCFGCERHGLSIEDDAEFTVILNHVGDKPPPCTPRERTIGVTLEPMWSEWNFRPDFLNSCCGAVLTPFPWRFDNGVFGFCLVPPWVGPLDAPTILKTRPLSIVVSPLRNSRSDTLYEFRHHVVDQLLGSKLECDIYGDWSHKPHDSRLKGWIDNKRDGIAAYERSIVLENSVYPGYSTEKLADCLVCETQAFYLGDPVAPLFFGDAIVELRRNDVISQLRRLLAQPYPTTAMQKARDLYRYRYNLFAQLANVIAKMNGLYAP